MDPPFTQWSTPHVATVLDKELTRQVTVDGVDYTVAVGPEGIRLKAGERPKSSCAGVIS
jgi:hypothetical protein